MSDLYSAMYNPDVLTCLANLSSDEVFTPPEVANKMLDMLPEDIWHDSSATFERWGWHREKCQANLSIIHSTG